MTDLVAISWLRNVADGRQWPTASATQGYAPAIRDEIDRLMSALVHADAIGTAVIDAERTAVRNLQSETADLRSALVKAAKFIGTAANYQDRPGELGKFEEMSSLLYQALATAGDRP